MAATCVWKRFHALLLAIALVFIAWVLAEQPAGAQLQIGPQPPSQATGTPGNYIVTFQAGTSAADRAASVRRAGVFLRFNYNIVDAVAVTIPNTNAFADLQRDPSVLEIIPDRPVYAIQTPDGNGNGNGQGRLSGDGTSSAQVTPEGVKRVGIPTSSSNGVGIGVAITDTGIDLSQADLSIAAQSFTAFGTSCQDGNGHGTHVTGIVAALDNTIGVIGVAPASTPYCVKVLDNSGSGSDSTVMAGLDWIGTNATSVNPAIRAVNMSLGRPGTLNDNTALLGSVQALYNMGIVVVVAAGNDSSAQVKNMVPAGYPEVLAVASSTAKDGSNAGCRFFRDKILADTASYFSTDGSFDTGTHIGVTISTPGEDAENVTKACFVSSVGILSLRAGGGTTRMSGTSMATPHVAGIVTRILNAGSYSADASGVENVRTNLRNTADRRTVAPLDSPTSGYSFDGEREGIGQAP